MTPKLSDFTDDLDTSIIPVKGIAGSLSTAGIGTVQWTVEADDGTIHTFRIPGAYYVPNLPHRLFSPQHWAAQCPDIQDGTACVGKDKGTLYWDGRQRTVPLSKGCRIPLFHLHTVMACPSVLPEPTMTEDRRTNLMSNWHCRLGHILGPKLQALATQNIIPAILKDTELPLCKSCLLSTAQRRAWRNKGGDAHIVPKPCSKAGDVVSMDHLQSSTPGLVGQSKGRLTRARIIGATVFVDHYSSLSFVVPMKELSTEATIEAKERFGRFATSHGVQILHYHGDNGRFADKLFVAQVEADGQTISYCGVGAHHQNGRAEKRIRDLQDVARTAMVHAHRRWPSQHHAALWPYALQYANDVINCTPRAADGAIPASTFRGVKASPNLKDFHTWGAPTYVLKPECQGITKPPKWNERAYCGILLGRSPAHAASVALVLNIETGLITPQYHITIDENFHTVKDTPTNTEVPHWATLAGFDTVASVPSRLSPMSFHPVTVYEGGPLIDLFPPGHGPSNGPQQQPSSSREVAFPAEIHHPSDTNQQTLKAFAASNDPDILYVDQALRAPDREEFIKAMTKEVQGHEEKGHWRLIKRSEVPPGVRVLPSVWAMRRKRRLDTGEVYKHKARLNVHGGKQIAGEDFDETFAPVVTWMAIRLALTLAIMFQWVTRQMDFVQAYPQAEVDRPLFMEIPKHFEPDSSGSWVVELLMNLYGQRQAGHVWNEHRHAGFLKMGFTPSEIDPCVYYHRYGLVLVYVDDTIILSPSKEWADKLVQAISEVFEVTDEGDICDFLGVNTQWLPDGRCHLSQPRLISSIIRDVGLKDESNSVATPAASSAPLHRDEEGKVFTGPWQYRSVIGKLNHLAKSTRPDIAFAVHQCARFSASPKESHGKAVKRIARYLMSTADKGIYLTPDPTTGLECWVDADFAGNWAAAEHSDPAEDASLAKSRSGFIITYANCPLLWSSKMQTEVALSTTEAEYIALSQALREVIPLMELLKEMGNNNIKLVADATALKCTVFEDNSGALEMARVPKMRPRTKYIAVKYHHFRSHVTNGTIKLVKVPTGEQLADVFTKGLTMEQFTQLRQKIVGW